MDREDWIDLYRWLEAAKLGEIFARRDKAREVLRQLRDPDIRADVRRIIREMDRELVARADLARLRKRA
jgi:dephospho-CoA kinase